MNKLIIDMGIRAKREVGIKGPDVAVILALFGAALLSITAIMWVATGFAVTTLLLFSVVMLCVCLGAAFVRYWKYRRVERPSPRVSPQEKFLVYAYVISGYWVVLGSIFAGYALLLWLFSLSTTAYGIVAWVCAVFIVLGLAIRHVLSRLTAHHYPDEQK